jgi:hypothetical protein
MNTRIGLVAGLLVAGFVSAAAMGTETTAAEAKPAPAPEVSIPFINHGGIRDWQADKQVGLWIQDRYRKWFYAKLMGPCFGLDFALHIGFNTRPGDTLDRFSSIIVPHEGRCQIQSLTRSEGPPPPKKKSKKPAEPKPEDQAKAP